MRKILLIVAAVAIAACATGRPKIDKEAVDDFIDVRGLPELDKIRTDSSDSYYELNSHYVIYQTRKGDYLFRFSRRCWELDDDRIRADERWDANTIRARFETLRGCRIDRIYELTEADSEELKQLGEAPGNRS